MRWQSLIGWPLIFIQLLVSDPYREVIVAIQTFICAILTTLKFHNISQNIITIFIVILTCFTDSKNYPPAIASMVAYHTIIAAATIANMVSVRYACGNGCVRRAAHPRRSAKRAQALSSASRAQHLHPPICHPMISCTCAPLGPRISAGVGLRVYVDFDAIETYMKAFNFDSRTSTMRMGMTLAVTWLTHLWTLRLSHHTWTLRNSRHWKSDAYVHSRDAATTRRTCVRSHGQNRQTREGCVVCA